MIERRSGPTRYRVVVLTSWAVTVLLRDLETHPLPRGGTDLSSDQRLKASRLVYDSLTPTRRSGYFPGGSLCNAFSVRRRNIKVTSLLK